MKEGEVEGKEGEKEGDKIPILIMKLSLTVRVSRWEKKLERIEKTLSSPDAKDGHHHLQLFEDTKFFVCCCWFKARVS